MTEAWETPDNLVQKILYTKQQTQDMMQDYTLYVFCKDFCHLRDPKINDKSTINI